MMDMLRGVIFNVYFLITRFNLHSVMLPNSLVSQD